MYYCVKYVLTYGGTSSDQYVGCPFLASPEAIRALPRAGYKVLCLPGGGTRFVKFDGKRQVVYHLPHNSDWKICEGYWEDK